MPFCDQKSPKHASTRIYVINAWSNRTITMKLTSNIYDVHAKSNFVNYFFLYGIHIIFILSQTSINILIIWSDFAFHYRSSPPELFLRKGVPKICSKFTGEHLCRSVISIKLLCKFIEITLRHGYSPVNLLHIFRTPFHKNSSGGLFLSLF